VLEVFKNDIKTYVDDRIFRHYDNSREIIHDFKEKILNEKIKAGREQPNIEMVIAKSYLQKLKLNVEILLEHLQSPVSPPEREGYVYIANLPDAPMLRIIAGAEVFTCKPPFIIGRKGDGVALKKLPRDFTGWVSKDAIKILAESDEELDSIKDFNSLKANRSCSRKHVLVYYDGRNIHICDTSLNGSTLHVNGRKVIFPGNRSCMEVKLANNAAVYAKGIDQPIRVEIVYYDDKTIH